MAQLRRGQGRSPSRAGSGTPFLGQRCALPALVVAVGLAVTAPPAHAARGIPVGMFNVNNSVMNSPAVRLRAALRPRPGHDRLPLPLAASTSRAPTASAAATATPTATAGPSARASSTSTPTGTPNLGEVLAQESVNADQRYNESKSAYGVSGLTQLLYFNMGGVRLTANRMYAMVYTNADPNPGRTGSREQPGRQGVRGRPQRPQHDRSQRRRRDRRPRPARGRGLVEQRRLLMGVGPQGRRGQHVRRLRRVRQQRRRHAPVLVRDQYLVGHPAGVQPALLRLHGAGLLHAEADQRAAPGDPDRSRRLRAVGRRDRRRDGHQHDHGGDRQDRGARRRPREGAARPSGDDPGGRRLHDLQHRHGLQAGGRRVHPADVRGRQRSLVVLHRRPGDGRGGAVRAAASLVRQRAREHRRRKRKRKRRRRREAEAEAEAPAPVVGPVAAVVAAAVVGPAAARVVAAAVARARVVAAAVARAAGPGGGGGGGTSPLPPPPPLPPLPPLPLPLPLPTLP